MYSLNHPSLTTLHPLPNPTTYYLRYHHVIFPSLLPSNNNRQLHVRMLTVVVPSSSLFDNTPRLLWQEPSQVRHPSPITPLPLFPLLLLYIVCYNPLVYSPFYFTKSSFNPPHSLPLVDAITHCHPSRAIQNSFAGTAVSGGRRCGIHPHR